MSTLATNAITDASGGNTTTINGYTPTVSNMAGRNLIINGDMRIAQRGTSATGLGLGDDSTYNTVDRWKWRYSGSITSEYTESQSTDSPDDFSFSRKFECTTAGAGHNYIETYQAIEAYNVAHLNYGSSAAKTLTLSFWVKCSQTGIGSVFVFAADSARSFTANYTISAANTWEYKTVTIVGDVSGTGISSDNGEGLRISFGLAANSSYTSGTANTWAPISNANRHAGLTLDISSGVGEYLAFTGVQLEAGSVATPFEHRQYGTELQLCQRYFQIYGGQPGGGPNFQGYGVGDMNSVYPFTTEMRVIPTSATSGNFQKSNSGDPAGVHTTTTATSIRVAVPSLGKFEVYPAATTPYGKITFSAEL